MCRLRMDNTLLGSALGSVQFMNGVENFWLAAAVEVLPALLHASFHLFYTGLIEFLLNINHAVAYVLLAWVVVRLFIYFILTIMP